MDYEMRNLSQEQWKEEKEVDEYYIEDCQTQYELHERLGNKREANFYWWVLGLVDRLEEAAYEWEEQKEEVQSLQRYIEDWQVGQNIGKHFDSRY